MSKLIIKQAITTEKSFQSQDSGYWTFLVNPDANKHEIKIEIERMFGVQVENVTTSARRQKIRRLKGSRFITKRKAGKVARVKLKKDSKKIDLTKLSS